MKKNATKQSVIAAVRAAKALARERAETAKRLVRAELAATIEAVGAAGMPLDIRFDQNLNSGKLHMNVRTYLPPEVRAEIMRRVWDLCDNVRFKSKEQGERPAEGKLYDIYALSGRPYPVREYYLRAAPLERAKAEFLALCIRVGAEGVAPGDALRDGAPKKESRWFVPDGGGSGQIVLEESGPLYQVYTFRNDGIASPHFAHYNDLPFDEAVRAFQNLCNCLDAEEVEIPDDAFRVTARYEIIGGGTGVAVLQRNSAQ